MFGIINFVTFIFLLWLYAAVFHTEKPVSESEKERLLKQQGEMH